MMVRWNSTKKRWRKAADEATAISRFGVERDRLASEVAKCIWVANGGREWADARGEGSLLALEMLVVPHLNDSVVRSALALRYVSVLDDIVRRADYEDVRATEAEARWAEEYLLAEMLNAVGAGERQQTTSLPQTCGDRLNRLRERLAGSVTAELKSAAIAAA